MEISIRYVGTKIIEMSIVSDRTQIVEDITDLNGVVDFDLIEQLKEIVYDLEAHNMELLEPKYCNKCFTFANHINGECLRCKNDKK